MTQNRRILFRAKFIAFKQWYMKALVEEQRLTSERGDYVEVYNMSASLIQAVRDSFPFVMKTYGCISRAWSSSGHEAAPTATL